MVGDGINDAWHLRRLISGSRSARGPTSPSRRRTSRLVSRPASGRRRHRALRRTLATIKGNLFWAFAYNVAAIPLAVAGLLNPIVAAAAMAFRALRRDQPAPVTPLPLCAKEDVMTEHGYTADKDAVRRLHRIEGQSAGSSGWSRMTATASTCLRRSPR